MFMTPEEERPSKADPKSVMSAEKVVLNDPGPAQQNENTSASKLHK